MAGKLLGSFKSTDFDTDFFISEASKSGRKLQVLSQLEQAADLAEGEMKAAVREASQIVLGVADTADATIGELLSLREHVSVLRDALDQLNHEEQQRLGTMRQTVAQLDKAIVLSQLLRKVSRVSVEVAKLKAQFPSSGKCSPADLRPVLELAKAEDFIAVNNVKLLSSEVAWIKAVIGSNS